MKTVTKTLLLNFVIGTGIMLLITLILIEVLGIKIPNLLALLMGMVGVIGMNFLNPPKH